MNDLPTTVLLVDDDAADAEPVQTAPNRLIPILSAASDKETARPALPCSADDHVAPPCLPCTRCDVIEREASQSAPRNSEERFRAMSDASPLGIFASDAQGRCEYVNAAYQKISGRSLAQMLGTNWSMTFHPEDRQRALAEWRAAARSQLPFHSELRFLREDGSIIWARVNAAPLGGGGTAWASG